MPDPRVDRVEAVSNLIKPYLAGLGAEVQGAVLADLVAIHLAGHIAVGDPTETERLRAELLSVFLDAVRDLVVVHEKRIHGDPQPREGVTE